MAEQTQKEAKSYKIFIKNRDKMVTQYQLLENIKKVSGLY